MLSSDPERSEEAREMLTLKLQHVSPKEFGNPKVVNGLNTPSIDYSSSKDMIPKTPLGRSVGLGSTALRAGTNGRMDTERGLLETEAGFNPAFHFHQDDFLDLSLRTMSYGDSQNLQYTVTMPQEDSNLRLVP